VKERRCSLEVFFIAYGKMLPEAPEIPTQS